MARRVAAMPGMAGLYGQVVHAPGVGPQAGRWNGKVVLNETALEAPLRRKKPTMYFVNSMSDLFHESVDKAMLDRIYAVMLAGPQHVFQVLTKRPERQREYLSGKMEVSRAADFEIHVRGDLVSLRKETICRGGGPGVSTVEVAWPPANVWHGVSVEDQAAADARVPVLLDTPSAVRFLSCEPLLGPVDLGRWLFTQKCGQVCNACGEGLRVDRVAWPCDHTDCEFKPLHWVIAGGESGHGARAMHPEWVRGIRDACAHAGVPFFFKQWGEWAPLNKGCRAAAMGGPGGRVIWANEAEKRRGVTVWRVGKKAAGRELDGREWSEMPGVGGEV
jgi:protein gp37